MGGPARNARFGVDPALISLSSRKAAFATVMEQLRAKFNAGGTSYGGTASLKAIVPGLSTTKAYNTPLTAIFNNFHLRQQGECGRRAERRPVSSDLPFQRSPDKQFGPGWDRPRIGQWRRHPRSSATIPAGIHGEDG